MHDICNSRPYAIELKCENFVNPLGIGIDLPLLSWRFEQTGYNCSQSKWQVIASSTLEKLHENQGNLWNSGEVDGNTTFNRWRGSSLKSLQQVYWKVRVCGNQGNWSKWSSPASFQTGVLEPSQWLAEWIGGFPRLIKYFDVKKDIKRAVIFVSGRGMYELRLNGCKVGDRELTPTDTDVSKRAEYAAWDVSDLLTQGENGAEFFLGTGWFRLYWHIPRSEWKPGVFAELHIEYSDGDSDIIKTDQSWKGTTHTPILESCLYDGEIYDANLEEMPTEWEPCQLLTEISLLPSPRIAPPIRQIQMMAPVSITYPIEGTAVVDFGTNFAGWCKITLCDPQGGQKITMKFAELLHPDGTVNQGPLRSAKARDIYITRPGEQSWQPRFTYHGFRYVQIEGWNGTITPDNIVGVEVHSDLKRTGHFSCSDTLLNRIYEAMLQTQVSNLHDKPTDCCQRDERVGWLGGGQFAFVGCIYNRDAWGFYRKWLRDIADGQDETGMVVRGQAPAHCDSQSSMPMLYAFFGVTWKLWKFYGDIDCVREYYPALKKFYERLRGYSEDGLFLWGWVYGDWLATEYTPREQIENVFYYHSAVILTELAEVLEFQNDAEYYRRCADETRSRYNERWYSSRTGYYGQWQLSQSGNAMPYAFGLVPEDDEKKVMNNLLWNICEERDEIMLTGGYSGQQYILESLLMAGRNDIILAALQRDRFPSWGFMLANGATTLWERWEKMLTNQMNCHNQFAQSSSVHIFHRAIVGLDWPMEVNGIRTFRVHPYLFKTLDWAAGELETPWGICSVDWQSSGDRFELTVNVPANTRACLSPIPELSDNDKKNVIEIDMENDNVLIGSGKWKFVFNTEIQSNHNN